MKRLVEGNTRNIRMNNKNGRTPTQLRSTSKDCDRFETLGVAIFKIFSAIILGERRDPTLAGHACMKT